MTEQETRQAEIEWFKSLLEILKQGDISTAIRSVEGAIKTLQRPRDTQHGDDE